MSNTNDKNTPKITLSVIIPVYNVEPYLARCLDSVLAQDVDGMEIICVNDGSTDHSLDVLEQYAMRDDRIRIISKENGGQGSARKAGLHVARGTYIGCVDSDDWIEPEMYPEMLRAIREADADIVTSGIIRDYGTYRTVDLEGIGPGLYTGDALTTEVKCKLIDTDHFYNCCINGHITNKLYRREHYEQYQMAVDDCITFAEDAAVVYPAMLGASRAVIMGGAYYHYCVRPDSICSKPSLMEAEKTHLFAEYMRRAFAEHPEVTNGSLQCKSMEVQQALLSYPPEVIIYQNGFLSLYGEIAEEERVVLYGAGKLGQCLHEILEDASLQVVAWADKHEDYMDAAELMQVDFDKILIGVTNYEVIREIREELIALGIPSEKILAPDITKCRERGR